MPSPSRTNRRERLAEHFRCKVIGLCLIGYSPLDITSNRREKLFKELCQRVSLVYSFQISSGFPVSNRFGSSLQGIVICVAM